jgi:hypothetical protein
MVMSFYDAFAIENVLRVQTDLLPKFVMSDAPDRFILPARPPSGRVSTHAAPEAS